MDQVAEFLGKYNPDNKASRMLDTKIDKSEFPVLAKHFNNVNVFTEKMGLTAAETGDVKFIAASQGNTMAMLSCFKTWRGHNPADATYRTLLKIVLKVAIEETELAEKVLKHMIDNNIYPEVQPVELCEMDINWMSLTPFCNVSMQDCITIAVYLACVLCI